MSTTKYHLCSGISFFSFTGLYCLKVIGFFQFASCFCLSQLIDANGMLGGIICLYVALELKTMMFLPFGNAVASMY